jgi:hypothetical protein
MDTSRCTPLATDSNKSNADLEDTCRRWYPAFRSKSKTEAKAAWPDCPREFYTLKTPQWLALNAAPGSRPNYSIDHRTSNVCDNQHIPENEQAMSNTISGSSKSRIHRPPQRDGGEPYEPAPLRYMRSVHSGPSDDSLSWVVGKKTRAEHSSGPRKQGRSFWDVASAPC